MPKTLRGRLVLTYAAMIVVLVATLGGSIVFTVRSLYVDQVTGQLIEEARLAAEAVAPSLAPGADPAAVDPLVKRLGADLGGRLTIIAADGRVLGDSEADPAVLPNLAEQPEVRQALAAGTESREVAVSKDGAAISVAVPVPGAPNAVVRISVALREVDAAVRRIQRDLIAGAIVGVALAAAVAFFIAQRIAGPLDALRRGAAAVSAGRLDVTVEPVEPRELGELARSFNLMTARIRELIAASERDRSRLEAIFTNLSDGVVVVDRQGTVLTINAAACAMLGAEPTWALGQPFVVVARDHDLVSLLREAFDAGGVRSATIEYTRGGRVIEAAAQAVAGAGEQLGVVVLRDVTALRRLEMVRREFVANVSHELRTPLASIRALVETLEAGAIDDPAVAGEFLRRVVEEVDRLAALVDELLDLARLESGRLPMKIEAVQPHDLVVRGVERLRPQIERARLELTLDVPEDLPLVLADPARIEQVLLNLVHNAIKFTPAGGRIKVSAAADDELLTVSVQDTGVGIPEQELPRVFERFYKADRARRSEGTGLGLAIAKHIVQAHRGTIGVTSAPGEGSTFTFTLPLAPPPASERTSPPDGQPPTTLTSA